MINLFFTLICGVRAWEENFVLFIHIGVDIIYAIELNQYI